MKRSINRLDSADVCGRMPDPAAQAPNQNSIHKLTKKVSLIGQTQDQSDRM